MASEIETMFSSIRSKIDEEYSRIMFTFHQDISTNLSSDDFTEDYGKVDLKYFKKHPEGGWFIYEFCSYNSFDANCGRSSKHIAIDNYGNIYTNNNNYGSLTEEFKIDNLLYNFPNFLIDNFKLLNKSNTSNTHIIKPYIEQSLKEQILVFQNLAKEYHNKFVIYKHLFNGNTLKEYTELVEEKEKEIISKNKLSEHNKKLVEREEELVNKYNILSDKYNKLIDNLNEFEEYSNNLDICNNKLQQQHTQLEENIKQLKEQHVKEIIKIRLENNKVNEENKKYIETISVLNEKIFQLKKHIADLSVAQNTNPFT